MTTDVAQVLTTDVESIELSPDTPTREDVVRLILEEAHGTDAECEPGFAREFLGMLDDAVVEIRSHHYTEPYIFWEEEYDRFHGLLHVIIPGHSAPADGSAHAAINRYLLRGRELSLMHTVSLDGEYDWCAMTIDLVAA